MNIEMVGMVVIIENNGYIDLEMPVYMSDEQRRKFIYLIKMVFGEVEVIEVEEPPGHKIEGKTTGKWTVEELKLLFSSMSEDEIAEKINRSIMSVRMKIGTFKPEFYYWASKKKKVINKKTLDSLIKEFLKEKYGEKL